ncbi:MAG: ATP-binding protein [Candidatus Limnocylindria bacterium]
MVVPAATTEERRIVTALFCDLVGFTASSENADPEDVDRMLSAYAAMARREIEYHGGVVEKFIGDAVVGVFGVPTAHEDDAERAVRAGLGICASAAELQMAGDAPLRLRVGINTGEVLARMSVEPGSGERFLAGDPINTASRIQSAAPEMGVTVGPRTYGATKATVEYRALEPVTLKGKAEPLPIFEAIGSRSKTGVDLTGAQASRYIGRQEELASLRAVFDMARKDRTTRLATVIADAGMGKSRIVAELRTHARKGPEPVTWHQGRCLPYGEGITFWALGEIVKTHAGILESDSPATASDKLDDALPASAQQVWLRERMLPLIGLESAVSATREESFAAWHAFIQGMASSEPLVLVFEDLHWADTSMLEFLEYLAVQPSDDPILLLGTARPELLAKHPDFAASVPNARRISLQPLSTDDTATLVTSLIGAVVPDELAAPIIERADGNPLYAEEYVRLLRDRDLIVEADGAVVLRPGVELPLPESIHAVLAARLDTLPPAQRALLGDAAVIGKVFWNGALQEMGNRSAADVEHALGDLSELGFLRPAAQSSMGGEHEFAFWHVLGRDVAYGQLPRAARAAKHAAAATWLESKLGGRVDDIADVLADHWGTALDLSKAAGQQDRAKEYEPKVIGFLVRAGERAKGLDPAAAMVRFDAALRLASPGHLERPGILLRLGEAGPEVGRIKESYPVLEEAVASFDERGDWRSKARALIASKIAYDADTGLREKPNVLDRAIEILEAHEPTPELIDALTERGVDLTFGPLPASAFADLDRAMAVAVELGLPKPGRALGFRGHNRLDLGDRGGIDDFREAIALCVAAGDGHNIAVNKVNLGTWLWKYEGPAPAVAQMRDAMDDARRFGFQPLLEGMTLFHLQVVKDTGAYDEVIETWETVRRPGDPAMRQSYHAPEVVYALRGRRDEAMAQIDELEELARGAKNAEPKVALLANAAFIRATFGDPQAACALLEEVLAVPDGKKVEAATTTMLPTMIRVALEADRLDLAERLLADLEPRYPYAAISQDAMRARVAEAHGRLDEALEGHRDAATRWAEFGIPLEEGHARFGEARCLIGLGRHTEAEGPLSAARAIFERLRVPAASAATHQGADQA